MGLWATTGSMSRAFPSGRREVDWCTSGSPVGLDHIYFFFGFFVGFAGGRPFVEPYVPLPCGIIFSYSGLNAARAAAAAAAAATTASVCTAAHINWTSALSAE